LKEVKLTNEMDLEEVITILEKSNGDVIKYQISSEERRILEHEFIANAKKLYRMSFRAS
jgi:hypothetical protein